MKQIITLLFILLNSSIYSQTFLDYYFKSKEVDGAILIYDKNKDSWLFNSEYDVNKETPIGSLFNIPNALIALDLGMILNNPANYFAWDGVKRYYFGKSNPNWNCNTNLDEALKYKTDWYFQEVSNLVGFKNYSFFLNKLNITNSNYNRKENFYWHFGNLKTTPKLQLDFFKKLKNQEIIWFQKYNQKYVYDELLLISDRNYSIHGYETYNVYKGERIDWWVGVLETKDNTYYFSTRIFESINKEMAPDFFNKKYEITLEIFRVLGYI